MTTEGPLPSPAMSTREIDLKTRQRIAAHMRRLKYKFECETDADLARRAGLSRSVINRILKAERTPGLDVVLKIHRSLHISIDQLVDQDPDPKWFHAD